MIFEEEMFKGDKMFQQFMRQPLGREGLGLRPGQVNLWVTTPPRNINDDDNNCNNNNYNYNDNNKLYLSVIKLSFELYGTNGQGSLIKCWWLTQ